MRSSNGGRLVCVTAILFLVVFVYLTLPAQSKPSSAPQGQRHKGELPKQSYQQYRWLSHS
ncbi:hypothetical protein ACP70R_029540 [Stipagrostis hirtigluma subsp. patula]